MRARFFTLIAASVLLNACASLSPEQRIALCAPISIALTTPAQALRQSADAGDASAQLSLSIIMTYGLNGVPIDRAAADSYRMKALASRGSTTSAIYIPGGKRTGGHSQIVSAPIYGVTPAQIAAVDACLSVLKALAETADVRDRITAGACGGADNYRRLKDLWANATSRT